MNNSNQLKLNLDTPSVEQYRVGSLKIAKSDRGSVALRYNNSSNNLAKRISTPFYDTNSTSSNNTRLPVK